MKQVASIQGEAWWSAVEGRHPQGMTLDTPVYVGGMIGTLKALVDSRNDADETDTLPEIGDHACIQVQGEPLVRSGSPVSEWRPYAVSRSGLFSQPLQ